MTNTKNAIKKKVKPMTAKDVQAQRALDEKFKKHKPKEK